MKFEDGDDGKIETHRRFSRSRGFYCKCAVRKRALRDLRLAYKSLRHREIRGIFSRGMGENKGLL